MRWHGATRPPGLTGGLATCCARAFDGEEPPATPTRGGKCQAAAQTGITADPTTPVAISLAPTTPARPTGLP
jgi:hypothetical protein